MKIPAIVIFCSTLPVTLALLSWGKTGHRTIGLIAQHHLTAKAASAIQQLLGDTSLADISNYADEIRSTAQYKYTAPWHDLNIPARLDSADFAKAVTTQTEDNVYNALLKLEEVLRDPSKTKTDKAFALKLIVHFIGDLHQPMHVAREGDSGGSDVQITFDGKKGNLHGLWDNGFINHQNLTYQQMAIKYDTASPEQISQWQHDDMMKWLYESYQISNKLYQDAATNPNFDEAYYQLHLPIIEERIEKAGIRLAGVLNDLYL